MLSLAWTVPSCGSQSLPENTSSAKEYISPDLYLWQYSTLLTSSFIDSFFHSLTFHSLLYSSDSGFISLINNRWDTSWFPWIFKNYPWPRQQLSFEIYLKCFFSSQRLFYKQDLHHKESTIHVCFVTMADTDTE